MSVEPIIKRESNDVTIWLYEDKCFVRDLLTEEYFRVGSSTLGKLIAIAQVQKHMGLDLMDGAISVINEAREAW
jgi:hypothetical protein